MLPLRQRLPIDLAGAGERRTDVGGNLPDPAALGRLAGASLVETPD